MSVHLREHYGHSIPQLQFDALLDLCDRAMPGTEHKGEHCRFCGEVISLAEAQNHLGSHMETLALFVLPNNDDIEEEVASENSIQAELSDPESGTNDGKSEKSNLSIYAPESPKTSFSFFTDALPVDEMDIVSKFAAWSVEEEDESNVINVRGVTRHEESTTMTNVDTTGPPEENEAKSINTASQMHNNPSLTYDSQGTPPFVFRIEEIAEHPRITPRTTRESWRPPINPGWSYSLGTVSSDLYGYCDGDQISWLAQLPHGASVYKQYSTYYAEGLGFWILTGDGRYPPTDDDWHELRFDTYDDRGTSYLTNAGKLPTLHVQPAKGNGGWARMLLPEKYYSDRTATRDCPGGLTGELAIFLALIAFSTSRENLQGVLTYSFKDGRWNSHNWQAPRRSRQVIHKSYQDPDLFRNSQARGSRYSVLFEHNRFYAGGSLPLRVWYLWSPLFLNRRFYPVGKE
jgi:hypothetical protein